MALLLAGLCAWVCTVSRTKSLQTCVCAYAFYTNTCIYLFFLTCFIGSSKFWYHSITNDHHQWNLFRRWLDHCQVFWNLWFWFPQVQTRIWLQLAQSIWITHSSCGGSSGPDWSLQWIGQWIQCRECQMQEAGLFNWISANDTIATARGGGGGLALWKWTYQ
jgi:hypothetical protein